MGGRGGERGCNPFHPLDQPLYYGIISSPPKFFPIFCHHFQHLVLSLLIHSTFSHPLPSQITPKQFTTPTTLRSNLPHCALPNSFFSFLITFFTSFLNLMYLSQSCLTITCSSSLFLATLNFLQVNFLALISLSTSSDLLQLSSFLFLSCCH